MTTYQYGQRFSYPALALWAVLWLGFILFPSLRLRIFAAMIVPAAIQVMGSLFVRCTVCGKSVFLRETFSLNTFLGFVTMIIRPTPERTCSRCRAELDIQESDW